MPEEGDGRQKGPPRGEPTSDLAAGYRRAAPYIAASTQLVGSVAGMTLLGWWGDTELGHEVPWMLMLGAVLGAVGGFVSFFKTIATLGRERRG